jgi:hypothetical protein
VYLWGVLLLRESAIQKLIKFRLTQKSCVVYKFASPAQRGVPDLVVLVPDGRVVFMEVKQTGADATPQQHYHLARINAQGVRAGVVHSVDEAIALVWPQTTET